MKQTLKKLSYLAFSLWGILFINDTKAQAVCSSPGIPCDYVANGGFENNDLSDCSILHSTGDSRVCFSSVLDYDFVYHGCSWELANL